MIKKGHKYMKKILNWISIIIAVLAIFLVYLIFTQKDRKGAINVAEETLQYLKNGCIMYDNYSLGRESKDLMTIRSAAGVLTDYFGKTELTDEAWLTGYAENQNLTGIILTDQNGELLAGSEAAEYGIWTDILKKKNILDIAQNARKTYAEHIKLEDSSYDYAIASAPQISGLILVYRDTVSSGEDDNDITLNMLVSGYNFDMDAAVIITDEDIIRSSNIPELPEGLVEVSCQELSNDGIWSEIKFTCVDTGIGMSREFQKHVFDPFAQEQSEARTRYAGTGLGLAIVKELVEQMGGKIEFSSEKGIGTVFIVTMKLKISSTIPEQEKKEKTPEKSIAGTRVLLVEDNDLNMEIAEFMLANANVQVVCAWNGQQAVELFEQSQQGEFDLILMDIMMPVMNGLIAAKTIRGMERKDAAEIPIIAMTANAFSDDIEQSREAGMNEHLSKPLDEQKLVEVIRKYIC